MQHSHLARWARTGCAALLLAGLAATTADTTAAAAPSGAAWSTTCDSEATESAGYRAVRGIDLPTEANWRGTTPPYEFDDTASVADGFDRVGYCMELTTATGSTWVWTSMAALSADTADLGLPTRAGQVWQRYADDLTVTSNQPAVPDVSGGAGWVEMWPNQYSASGTRQVPGASSTLYDTDDNVSTSLGYGSFQIHAFTDPDAARGPRPGSGATATPVLSVNAFTSATRSLDIGIGASDGQHPDWTFAGNAATYTKRRLTVYARPAAARVEKFPDSRQLFARPGQDATSVPVSVSGEAVDPDVTAVELRTERNGRTWKWQARVAASAPRFSFTVDLPVERVSTDLELWALTPDGDRRIARAVDVVAGDAFVVQGQSNAVATQYNGSSEADRSRWLRTSGSSTADPALSTAIDGWGYAVGDTAGRVGAVGQWAIRMARQISDERDVPVAVVNGGVGGRPIDYFDRNDADPTDPETNYGRLLRRLAGAGLDQRGAIDALLWYQGEGDRDDADHHVAGFTRLVADWRRDLGNLRVYVHQVRTSPCNNTEAVALRDAQRRLPGTIDNLRVLSTTDQNGHDGCHYAYAEGYQRMGDHAAATVLADQYDLPRPGVWAPDPRLAHRVADRPTEIVVALRSPTDPLTVESGAAADFRVPGAVVKDIRYDIGRGLVLTLDQPVPADATVAYVGHLRSGPRIMTTAGVGLLAFRLAVA